MSKITLAAFGTIASLCLALAAPLPGTADTDVPFSVEGEDGVVWTARCAKSGITTTHATATSRHNCFELEQLVNAGKPPKPAWRAQAPSVGRAALPEFVRAHEYMLKSPFRKPAVTFTNGRASVFLAPSAIISGMDAKKGEKDLGAFEEPFIWLSIEPHFMEDGTLDRVLLAESAAHELFHALQQRYFDFDPDTQGWFGEGTAEYFAHFYEALRRKDKTFNPFRDRDFERPLNKPGDGGYANSIFFALLGRRIAGNAPHKGISGLMADDVKPDYLHEIFKALAIDGGSDLARLDRGIRSLHTSGLGLRKMYPEVIKDLTYAPDYKNKNFAFASRVPRLKTKHEPGWSEEEGPFAVKPLATRFFLIDSRQFNERGALQIEIVMPEGSENRADDLHLAVQGTLRSYPGFKTYHNVAVVGKDEEHQTIIAVANVSENPDETKPLEFKIRLSWLEAGICDYAALYHASPVPRHIEAAIRNGAGSDILEDWHPDPQTYLKEHGRTLPSGALAPPKLHPSRGRLSISAGDVTVSGDACTHHLATAPMMEAKLFPGESRLPTAGQQTEDFARQMQKLMAGDLGRELQKMQEDGNASPKPLSPEALSALQGAFGADPRQASVVISLFSPHMDGFWGGAIPAVMAFPKTHNNGGWDPDTQGAISLILLNTKFGDLKKGKTYPAYSLAPGGSVLVGMRWRGNVTPNAATGTFQEIHAGRLSGTVTITKIGGGRVEGTFRLSGEGTVEDNDFGLDANGLSTQIATRSGVRNIEATGSFSAPALVTGPHIFKHSLMLRAVSGRKDGQ